MRLVVLATHEEEGEGEDGVGGVEGNNGDGEEEGSKDDNRPFHGDNAPPVDVVDQKECHVKREEETEVVPQKSRQDPVVHHGHVVLLLLLHLLGEQRRQLPRLLLRLRGAMEPVPLLLGDRY